MYQGLLYVSIFIVTAIASQAQNSTSYPASIFLGQTTRVGTYPINRDTANEARINAGAGFIRYRGNDRAYYVDAFVPVNVHEAGIGTQTNRYKPPGWDDIPGGYRNRCHMLPKAYGGSGRDHRNIVACSKFSNLASNEIEKALGIWYKKYINRRLYRIRTAQKPRNGLRFIVSNKYKKGFKQPVATEMKVFVRSDRDKKKRYSHEWQKLIVHFVVHTKYTNSAVPLFKRDTRVIFKCHSWVHDDAKKGLRNENYKYWDSKIPCCKHNENPFFMRMCSGV